MKRIILPAFLILFCLILATNLKAEIVKDIRELFGENRFIEVSLQEINHIKLPVQIKEVKTSKKLTLNIENKSLFVRLNKNEPAELFIILNDEENRVVNIILIPKSIPAETVEIIDPTKKNEKIRRAEKSLPYEVVIRNMVISAKNSGKIDGYFKKDFTDENIYFSTDQLYLKKLKELKGYRYKLEIWEVTNISGDSLYLKERDFYTQGMRAISLDKHELPDNGTTKAYIVYPVEG